MAEVRPIDANALEKYIRGYCRDCNSYDGIRCRACNFGDALDAVDDAPTLDYAPVRHGEWKKRKNWSKYVCSECSHEYEAVSHFCPNCGAKMDGDQHG